MRSLGTFSNTQTVRFKWNSQGLGGVSITRATNGSIRVYRDDGLVQRASSSGITDTEDFDGVIGQHLVEIDLTDNADPNFYRLGQFSVVLVGATIEGVTVNAVIGYFVIGEAIGGESPDDWINPVPGYPPTDQPQVFFTVTPMDNVDEFPFVWAESRGGPFQDDADWFGGFKEARILSVSPIKRSYQTTTGGLNLTNYRLVLDDADSGVRAEFDEAQINGLKGTTYVIDHPDRIAKREPYRVAAGVIVNDGVEPDSTYAIEVEGMLGRFTATVLRDRVAPAQKLLPADFPELTERWADGWVPPIGYGELSDENEANPQGVVPGVLIAEGNLTALGGIDQEVLAFAFFGHAIQDTINIYYNDPDDDVVINGLPRRKVVPFSEYGVRIWAPHKPGWSDTNGGAGEYTDFNGYRLTIVFVDATLGAISDALRNGNIQLTGNFRAIENAGDGTGQLITDPVRIFAHFWQNFVENTYVTGTWAPSFEAFGVYSLFDGDRLNAAEAYSQSLLTGGLKGALLIGHEGKAESLWDVIKQMSSNWDLDIGENQHGQIVADYEDLTATPVKTFTAQHDIIALRTKRDRAGYGNAINTRYGYRYALSQAPGDAPEEGDPLPTGLQTPKWIGSSSLASGAAIAANNGKEAPIALDLYAVRDLATAEVIQSRVLARAIGHDLRGPVDVEILTGWQGAGFVDETVSPPENVPIDLHSMIAVTHVQGLGVGGWTERAMRVRSMSFDVLAGTITLGCRL